VDAGALFLLIFPACAVRVGVATSHRIPRRAQGRRRVQVARRHRQQGQARLHHAQPPLMGELEPDGEFLLLEEHQVHRWLPVAADPDEDGRLRDGGSAVQHRWSLV